MANRAPHYMDRLLGRNEGSESRDFTEGRRYGEDQRYFNDPYNDSASEWNRSSEFRNRGFGERGWNGRDREYQGRFHRTQASRNRPRPTQYRSDYERDYNVRNQGADYMDYNPQGTTRGFDYNVRENADYNAFRDEDFYSERDRGFRNTEYGNANMRREGSSGIFGRGRQENRGFFGRGPKGWKWSDERIKEQVSESLYRDYNVDASEIEVEVKDGIVTLTGSVDSREAKRAAEECIENLSGVSDVHNRIRISENTNVSNLRNETGPSEKRALS